GQRAAQPGPAQRRAGRAVVPGPGGHPGAGLSSRPGGRGVRAGPSRHGCSGRRPRAAARSVVHRKREHGRDLGDLDAQRPASRDRQQRVAGVDPLPDAHQRQRQRRRGVP
ncbi:hypothetical protein RZS08_03760, partial [Arthrospira platensis SPKY1]|nr:hypothetical protein [Arthrospira platensis SPKY1]